MQLTSTRPLLVVAVSAIVGTLWYYQVVAPILNASSRLAVSNPQTTSFMEYRKTPAVPLRWVPFARVPTSVICAVVKAEDRYFFRHDGVDWDATRKASLQIPRRLRRKERLSGASTITQQLARNLFLTANRSVGRKVKEMAIALHLDRKLSKARILELYLNTAEFGDGVWGIGAASHAYFRLPAESLDVFRGIVLASVLADPLQDFGPTTVVRRRSVQRRVLAQMFQSGTIDSPEALAAAHGFDTLWRAVSEGSGTPTALGLATRAARRVAATSPARTPSHHQSIVESECGLERELSMAKRAARFVGNRQ